MKKFPVVHFEMPVEDNARAKKFYEEAFGWDMQQLGEEMDSYIMAGTTETGENGMPKNPGEINGGLYKKTDDLKEPSVVIAVDDLHKHIEIVRNAGGEIIGEPVDIPGIGNFVSIRDTEGNRVGMLQPAPMPN